MVHIKRQRGARDLCEVHAVRRKKFTQETVLILRERPSLIPGIKKVNSAYMFLPKGVYAYEAATSMPQVTPRHQWNMLPVVT